MVMGGIVPVVNIEGIKPGELTIDGPTLARIFLGEIKTWNDPAIAKLNPRPSCPRRRSPSCIAPTAPARPTISAYYLAEVSLDWKSKVGFNTSVEWPVGIGAKGNEGVANNVAQTKGSIGYVEYAYAKQNKLTFTKMINKDGKAVAPTSATFQAAAANADWNSVPGYGVILANQSGAESWPMTAATWILMYKKPQDATATTEALKPGPTTRLTRWPRTSTTSRCRTTSSRASRRPGRATRTHRASRCSRHPIDVRIISKGHGMPVPFRLQYHSELSSAVPRAACAAACGPLDWALRGVARRADAARQEGFVVDVALQGDAIPAGAMAARAKALNKLRITDVVFRALTRAAAIGVLGILGGVILSLIAGSRLALSTFGFNFLVSERWNPVTENFGALAPIYGTLVTSSSRC